jgi:hypothetical protein
MDLILSTTILSINLSSSREVEAVGLETDAALSVLGRQRRVGFYTQ